MAKSTASKSTTPKLATPPSTTPVESPIDHAVTSGGIPEEPPTIVFHDDRGEAVPSRHYSVVNGAHERGTHAGRGLTPRDVLAVRAHGHYHPLDWSERRNLNESREDAVVFEDNTIVGVILNSLGSPYWFDGKPLALEIVVDGNGTRFEVVPPGPWKRGSRGTTLVRADGEDDAS